MIMASNSFGNIFRITTWGESHGKAIGVVIDGCPAGLSISEAEINEALALRAPGRSAFTSPRKEADQAEIYSGVFEGKTTGAPISIIIPNQDADPSQYENVKNLLRPGHGNFTYLEKYGIFDYRGGGRASARETVARVAAGAVAKKLLQKFDIKICAYLSSVGNVNIKEVPKEFNTLKDSTLKSEIFCPDKTAEQAMLSLITEMKNQGDSVGGIVTFLAENMPVGFGDPVYSKLEANLASAMLSIPASKGFSIGEGFHAASMQGSAHNDPFTKQDEHVVTTTNHAGGTLGGISTGMPLHGQVAFKPTSSIKKIQETVDTQGNAQSLQFPESSRHDPCVTIRAVPIVEAMLSLVLADALLYQRSIQSFIVLPL